MPHKKFKECIEQFAHDFFNYIDNEIPHTDKRKNYPALIKTILFTIPNSQTSILCISLNRGAIENFIYFCLKKMIIYGKYSCLA